MFHASQHGNKFFTIILLEVVKDGLITYQEAVMLYSPYLERSEDTYELVKKTMGTITFTVGFICLILGIIGGSKLIALLFLNSINSILAL